MKNWTNAVLTCQQNATIFCAKTEMIWSKKALRETQTLRAGCSKAEPKIFAPLQTPSRGHRTAKI